MHYIQIPPPAALQHYVRYFWVVQSRIMDTSPTVFRPITDGCPGLVFQPPEAGSLHDQHRKHLSSLFLYGQTIRHREIHTTAEFDMTGVCFHPSALHSVFRLDATELTDTCIDLRLLPDNESILLADQLANAPSNTHRIDLLSAYLLARIERVKKLPDSLTEHAVRQLIRVKGDIALPELQRQLNVSERSFERRFRQSVGISPRLFSRICRFQASLGQLRGQKYDKLSDIAYENGYADQSHFIRVFREFAGFSPHQYQKQANQAGENLAGWQ